MAVEKKDEKGNAPDPVIALARAEQERVLLADRVEQLTKEKADALAKLEAKEKAELERDVIALGRDLVSKGTMTAERWDKTVKPIAMSIGVEKVREMYADAKPAVVLGEKGLDVAPGGAAAAAGAAGATSVGGGKEREEAKRRFFAAADDMARKEALTNGEAIRRQKLVDPELARIAFSRG